MEKMMILMRVEDLQTREFKRNDGSIQTIKSRNLLFTDGVDTIYGETSPRLIEQIETTNEALKLRLIEGHVYNVDFTINARDYEKDNKKNTFVSITINKVFNFL